MDSYNERGRVNQTFSSQSPQSVQPQTPQYQPPPPQPPSQPTKSSSNLVAIIIALAFLLLAIAVLVYVFTIAKNSKPIRDNQDKSVQVSPTTIPQEVVSPTQAISNGVMTISPKLTEIPSASPSPSLVANNVPAGYVRKTTLCYTILIPQDAKTGASNDCAKYITNGINSKYVYTEHIDPIFVSSKYNSLKDLVDKRVIDSTYRLVKDEDIVLDGIPAKKLTEENSKLKLSMVRVFVYLPNKYKSSGVDLAGFEISTTLDGNDSSAEQAHDRKVFETLLSSWQWK